MPTPPSAEAVALRAACLYCEFVRGWAEVEHTARDYATWRTSLTPTRLVLAANRFVEEWGIASALTKREARFLLTKLGRAKQYGVRNATWRAESSAVLAWALGRIKTLFPWQNTSGYLYRKSLRPEVLLKGDGSPFLAPARLRPRREIVTLHRVATLWTWRSRIEALMTGGFVTSEGQGIIKRQIEPTVIRAAARGDVEMIQGDLAVGKRPYSKFPEYGEYMWSFYNGPERHRALNWLMGEGADWDDIGLRTDLGFKLPRRCISSTMKGFNDVLYWPPGYKIY